MTRISVGALTDKTNYTNESFIEGDFLLKNELDPVRKEIRLTYAGKTISDQEKLRLLKRKAIYGLADAKIVIAQGFSISEVSKDLSQTGLYRAQINRLKNELSLVIERRDSISGQQRLGDPLLKEMKPLFPDVSYCRPKNNSFSIGVSGEELHCRNRRFSQSKTDFTRSWKDQ